MGIVLSLFLWNSYGGESICGKLLGERCRKDGQINLLSLPTEVIQNVMRYVKFSDVARMRQLCHRLDDVSKDFLNVSLHVIKKNIEQEESRTMQFLSLHAPSERQVELVRYHKLLQVLKCEVKVLESTCWTSIRGGSGCFYAGEILDEILKVSTTPRDSGDLQEELCKQKLQRLFELVEKFSDRYEMPYKMSRDRNIFWDLVEILNCSSDKNAKRHLNISYVGSSCQIDACFKMYGCFMQFIPVAKFTEQVTPLQEFIKLKKVFASLVLFASRNHVMYKLDKVVSKCERGMQLPLLTKHENRCTAFVKDKVFMYGYNARSHKNRALDIEIHLKFPPQSMDVDSQPCSLTLTEGSEINRSLLEVVKLSETCDCEIKFENTGTLQWRKFPSAYTLSVCEPADWGTDKYLTDPKDKK